MGCGSSQQEDQSEKLILLQKIKEKVTQLIKNNPFYTISVKDFDKFMKEESKKSLCSIENISKDIITSFFGEKDEITNYIFKTVVSFSYNKFKYVFHRVVDNDIEIIISIFYIMYLFLCDTEQKRRNNFLYKKIYKLFEIVKLKEEEGNFVFMSGKFFFLMFNLIQFCTFCFVNFFCGPGIIEITGNIKKYEAKKIFCDNESKSEKYQPNNINKLVNDFLYHINHNIQPNIVNYYILTDVLQPLSELISENKNESIFSINSVKLKDILDILIEKMNHNYYVELFFNIDNILK